LYHYAGNNPINYTDPNGRIVFNLPNHSVTVNLDDREDLQRAADVLAEPELGYTKVYAVGLNETVIYTSYSDIMKKLYPDTFAVSWDRADIENFCSWFGFFLSNAVGFSLIVCPCLTPFLLTALVVNDSVNALCRTMDFIDEPTKQNGYQMGFAYLGLIFDVAVSAGTFSTIKSFNINSAGKPYNPLNGRWISLKTAGELAQAEFDAWILKIQFTSIVAPFIFNFGLDLAGVE
jgi:hypothetical protein